MTQAEVDQVNKLAPYVNSAGVLDAKRAIAGGVSAKTISDYQAGYSQLAWNGLTQVGSTGTKVGTTRAATCIGAKGSVRYLTYVKTWMNSCDARGIVALMAGGAGLATLTGGLAAITGIGLPYTALAVIAAGLLGVGSAAVQWCSRYARGMVAQSVKLPPCYNQ